MAWLEKIHHPEYYIKTFLKWLILSLIVGITGGLLGAGFHHALHFVTHMRAENNWLIFLLPLGGLLTVAIYRLLGIRRNRGTNEIIDAILQKQPVSPMVAPAVFLASAVTHLFGGSAGREGAALQIGGSVASGLGKLLHLKDHNRTILVTCGMSAVFAGLFGTPLTATIFCMEFVSVGTLFTPALLPCYLSAFFASRISGGRHLTSCPYGIDPRGVVKNHALKQSLLLQFSILYHRIHGLSIENLTDKSLRN